MRLLEAVEEDQHTAAGGHVERRRIVGRHGIADAATDHGGDTVAEQSGGAIGNGAAVDGALRAAAEAVGLGLGKVAQPLRVAMTGSQVSPSIDHTVYLVGQARALARIDNAIRHIEAAAA